MENITIQDLMVFLPNFFKAERSAGIAAKVQFDLSGEDGGQWVVNIADAQCQVSSGNCQSPDLVFEASAQDVLDIFYDRMDAMTAYMQGRLHLTGNFGLALRLFNLFEIDEVQFNQLKNKKG